MVQDGAAHVAENSELDESELSSSSWLEFEDFEAMRWLTQIYSHWHMGVTTQVEVVFMIMTDSHPTWGQSPPLELDCTTRPDRRGELLCLPSPDRPIRAARNWEVLGPTARWEGLAGKWGGLRKQPRTQTPSTESPPNTQTIHTPQTHTCTVEWDTSAVSRERCTVKGVRYEIFP